MMKHDRSDIVAILIMVVLIGSIVGITSAMLLYPSDSKQIEDLRTECSAMRGRLSVTKIETSQSMYSIKCYRTTMFRRTPKLLFEKEIEE